MGPLAPSRNFEQNSPITTILRQICEAYPESSCLRELLQNADDAQASEVEYTLDTKTYKDAPLIDEGLQAYHGPALLVKNNSVFTDDDFASLASIGDSRKRTQLLDQRIRGVPANNFQVMNLHPQNHLKTFQRANIDTSQAIESTVIRIPLRTEAQAKKSKIVNRQVTVEEIISALYDLGQEIREGGTLFLRHVRRITVRIDDTVLWEACTTGATKEDTKYSHFFKFPMDSVD
ncbi:MAG: hypothetical protein Q9166_007757 [cf. Caloplaca sp. 2 TL-2023]